MRFIISLLLVILLYIFLVYFNKLIDLIAAWLLKSFSYRTHQIILNTQQMFLYVTAAAIVWYASLNYFFRKIYNIELYDLCPIVVVMIGSLFFVALFMYATIIRIYVGKWLIWFSRRPYNLSYEGKFILRKYNAILEDYNCIAGKQYGRFLLSCFIGAFCLFIATYILTTPFEDVVQNFCFIGGSLIILYIIFTSTTFILIFFSIGIFLKLLELIKKL